MTAPQIQVLLDGHKLEAFAFSDDQVVGLWNKAVEAYNDSLARPRSRNGQFRDLYEAGRIAATAIVAAAGYRPKGQAHHYAVLQAAAALSPEAVATAVFGVEGVRGNRHETNYSSADVIDEDDVAEIRQFVEVILSDGARHLRTLRPSAAHRIRITRPKPRG